MAAGVSLLTAGNHTFGIPHDADAATGSAVPAPERHATASPYPEGPTAAAAESVDMQSATNSGAAAETTAVDHSKSAAPEADSGAPGRSQAAQSAAAHAQAAADPAAAGATAGTPAALDSGTALPHTTVLLSAAAEASPAVLLQRTGVIARHLAAVPLIVSVYRQEHAESGAGEEVYGVRPDGDQHYCDMVRRECGDAVPTLRAMLEAL